MEDISSAIEAMLFAAGEAVPIARLSLILGEREDVIEKASTKLAETYFSERRGIRILKLENKLQMCSAPEYATVVTKILEQRKPPSLSQSALEVLAVTAYFQPVTRAYIEQLRGVDSSYTVGVLQERGLIEECGRLDVPGRPSLFCTTDAFLRTMGISSLTELPVLPEISTGEGVEKIKKAIDRLQAPQSEAQISLY